jgi:hypothetical protein
MKEEVGCTRVIQVKRCGAVNQKMQSGALRLAACLLPFHFDFPIKMFEE